MIWVRLKVNMAGIAYRDARSVRPPKVKEDTDAWLFERTHEPCVPAVPALLLCMIEIVSRLFENFLDGFVVCFHEKCYICSMNTKRKEKLGDLALDIAKYMITAVLLATWFKRTEQWAWYDFIIPVFVVIGLVLLGLYFLNDNKEERRN